MLALYLLKKLNHCDDSCRPVKVVRLVCRHTVEEIVLKRALAKLELTQTVIEGGQFSSVGSAVGGATDLSEIIKYGLDHLLQSEESTLVDEDLERCGCMNTSIVW